MIVAIKYATYIISFINHGIKEIDKTDEKLDEIIPENVSAEIEPSSEVEKSLLKILRLWGGITENVPLGHKWIKGIMLLQPADKSLKPDVRQREALRHRLCRRHITGWSQVSSVKARALIVFQLSTLGARKPGIREELIRSLPITSIEQQCSVKTFRNIDRCSALAGMEDGERTEVKWPWQHVRANRDDRRLPVRKKLATRSEITSSRRADRSNHSENSENSGRE